jgi:uncharacterized protein YjbI with pentapeptide repeats
MVVAKVAAVQPRVATEAAVPLEDVILSAMAAGDRSVLYVYGPPGSGKTTALEHLAAVLPPDAPIDLADESPDSDDPSGSPDRLLVCAAGPTVERPPGRVVSLRPWHIDELIEYLLHVHHDRCAEVMARIRPEDHALCDGSPELWTIVLDELACRPEMPDGRTALAACIESQLGAEGRVCAEDICLQRFTGAAEAASFNDAGFAAGAVLLLRHASVQRWLAAQRLAGMLCSESNDKPLQYRLPRELVTATATELQGRVPENLRRLALNPSPAQAMAASILRFVEPDWRPDPIKEALLGGAYLNDVCWDHVELPKVNLQYADLSGADLQHANLNDANAARGDLSRSELSHASLREFMAYSADLSQAVLRSVAAVRSFWESANLQSAVFDDAQLTGATFHRADMTGAMFGSASLVGANLTECLVNDADFYGADLSGATMAGLDLRTARLHGAKLSRANLSRCNLEDMDLVGVSFESANLDGALLTAADLSGADFTNACLGETGLGDVNMEGACLRDADLRGATFHMGSTRSGMLITPIASEGTRTGFYTDDYDDQHFKEPEEIRKANLRRADLRGARIEDVDFYLVDLRGALFDPDQERHFRRCRAILDDADQGS